MRVIDRVVEKTRQVPPIVADGAMASGIFALGAIGQLRSPDSFLPHSQRPAALGLLALAVLGVALRRKHLWAGYILVALAAIGGLFTWNDAWGNILAEVVLLYTVSEHCGLVVSLLALAASFMMPFVAQGHQGGTRLSDLPLLAESFYPQLVLVWFAGRAQARRRAIASDLERSVALLREEREQLARDAVATERARIARELHALVVRGVEGMNGETRAALSLLGSDPDQASKAIAVIETIGRDALVEMRRLLMVLRTRPDAAPSSTDKSWSRERAAPAVSYDDLPSRGPSQRARRWSLAPELWQRARAWVVIPWATDTLVVIVLAILAVTEPYIDPSSFDLRIYVPLATVAVGAVLFRRHLPLVVLAVVALEVFAWNAFLGGTPSTADRSMIVAVFTVAVLRGPWWSVVAIGVEVLAYTPLLLTTPPILEPYDLAGWSAFFLFAVIAGIAIREAGWLNRELWQQTDTLRRTREERVRLAVHEERSRIARDVHDMVAHGVTLMVIQAGAARWLAESDPLKADRALRSVEQAGQESLRELNSLVGSLGSSSPDGADPLPADEYVTIPSLVERSLESGTRVELVIRGEPRKLDAGLEVSLYRIVQEALTNVGKHAPGARVWVELRYTPDGVEVEVTDAGGRSGYGPSRAVPGAGQGLVGIAERAALFGGQAEAGPTPEGGFRVRASLAEERVLA